MTALEVQLTRRARAGRGRPGAPAGARGCCRTAGAAGAGRAPRRGFRAVRGVVSSVCVQHHTAGKAHGGAHVEVLGRVSARCAVKGASGASALQRHIRCAWGVDRTCVAWRLPDDALRMPRAGRGPPIRRRHRPAPARGRWRRCASRRRRAWRAAGAPRSRSWTRTRAPRRARRAATARRTPAARAAAAARRWRGARRWAAASRRACARPWPAPPRWMPSAPARRPRRVSASVRAAANRLSTLLLAGQSALTAVRDRP